MKRGIFCRSGLVSLAALVWFAGIVPAGAQTHLHRHKAGDSSERRKDRRELRDDRRDLKQLEDIVRDWKRAIKSRDKLAERNVDKRLRAWLRAELQESEREARDASHEAATSRPGHQRRDDVRDAREKQRDVRQTRAIARKLHELQPVFSRGTASPADYKQKRRLLKNLLQMARQEVRESREEVREDRREDRRDRRRNRH